MPVAHGPSDLVSPLTTLLTRSPTPAYGYRPSNKVAELLTKIPETLSFNGSCRLDFPLDARAFAAAISLIVGRGNYENV